VKAVILVGGEGTRLRPLTYHTPKQLLRVVGFPVLERVLATLKKSGIEEAYLSLGYNPEAFMRAYPDGVVAGVRVSYVVEDYPLDTAGAIRYVVDTEGIDETFVVVNGDVLTDLNVGDLVDFHGQSKALATVGLVTVPDPSAFGVVVTDDKGRALGFVEKPSLESALSHDINAGVYVMEPEALASMEVGKPTSIEREIFPQLVGAGRLYARPYSCYWLDAGTPQNYYRAVFDVLRRRWSGQPIPPRGRFERLSNADHLDSDVCYLGSSVSIAASSRVRGSVIEDGVTVHEGAHILDSVILESAVIGPDTRVENSIIGPETCLPEGIAILDLSVIAKSSVLAARDTLVAGVTQP